MYRVKNGVDKNDFTRAIIHSLSKYSHIMKDEYIRILNIVTFIIKFPPNNGHFDDI